MKVFQIVDGKCNWCTPYKTLGEVVGRYPADCVFVEAPDTVFEGWGYRTVDEEGNAVTGDDRFTKPVPEDGFFYDDDSGQILPIEELAPILERAKTNKQAENRLGLEKFLANHPLTYKDGKQYGITMEDQNEIQLNISQYQIQVQAGITPVLEWHAIHEACSSWTLEDLSALVLAISAAVYPWYRKMQEYKTAIYACTSLDEVRAVELVYKTEEELAAEEEAAKKEAESATDSNKEQ